MTLGNALAVGWLLADLQCSAEVVNVAGSLRWRKDMPNGSKEEKGPMVYMVGLGDSGVVMRLYYWATDLGAAFTIGCELTERIKERFQKAGVEIPYPHRVVMFRKERPAKRARRR